LNEQVYQSTPVKKRTKRSKKQGDQVSPWEDDEYFDPNNLVEKLDTRRSQKRTSRDGSRSTMIRKYSPNLNQAKTAL
jgi:hypothetical protein